MKIKLLFLLLTAFYKQAPPTASLSCGVENPLQELTWLKNKVIEHKNDGGRLAIMQAQYRGETVFFIEYVLGADARETTYYRCNGLEICQTSVTIADLTSNCFGDLTNELTERKIIYPEITMK